MSAPQLVVVLRFEDRHPRLYLDCADSSDEARLVDWLHANRSLLADAVELAEVWLDRRREAA